MEESNLENIPATEEKTTPLDPSESGEQKKEAKKEENNEPQYLKEARNAVVNLEMQNKRMEENLKRLEKLTAENILAGRAIAGQGKPKEESAKEYAQRMMKG